MKAHLELCVPHLRLCLRQAPPPALAFLRQSRYAETATLVALVERLQVLGGFGQTTGDGEEAIQAGAKQ